MSRSPSSFFRSNRRSRDEGGLSQAHRRTTSSSDTLDPPRTAERLAPSLGRSLSARGNASAASNGSAPPTASLRGLDRLERRRTMEERNFLQSKARAHALNPPVDLRLLDYVAPPDENLLCPICRCLFVDPVVLTECAHCFCRDCIRQTWTVSSAYNPLGPRGVCPTCRTPAKLGLRSAHSKVLTNILDDLLVKCPKSDEGCKSQVKRGEVQDHVNIYCGYALVECPDVTCESTVRRKDSALGCLHYPVSCLACHEEMERVHLELHWKRKCPDRRVACGLCRAKVFYRELSEHDAMFCPAVSMPCPGAALGCDSRKMKPQAEIHANKCPFAKMAPMFEAMKTRMDEQETATLEMGRKLEVLQHGYSAMRGILFANMDDAHVTGANPRPMPRLGGDGARTVDDAALNEDELAEVPASDTSSTIDSILIGHQASEAPLMLVDSDLASPVAQPSTNGSPYVSPLHHMLSMHESLRDDMCRVSSALQELDGRHSLQMLNDRLRTREEMQYLAAQVAGLSRQVGWLTSTQLQRPRRAATPAPGTNGGGDVPTAGPSLESAIRPAVRATARTVSSAGRGGGQPTRRGTSEEGRTKL